ncbi:MAG: hypothetical protein E7612_03995 [Ruminococcaceae bacterium]|nr:hypothetical protein [Oscillospiraceae bacterium]
MKIFKKRCLAYIIDAFIYSFLLVFFHEFVYTPTQPLVNLILFCPFFLKDCLFGNASIGKKIVGIVVYDNCWNKPTLMLSIKRTVMTSIFGYILIWKSVFIGGSKMVLFEWEKNVIKTFVIDKKVYKNLKADAEKMDGEFSKNMTELYMMYLRDFYLK